MSRYIEQIQSDLQDAGHYTGIVDGIAGKMTVTAVNKAIHSDKCEVKPAPKPSSKFTLSSRSLENLKGVKPDIVKVVKRAIEITSIDFMVFEGLRTVERQRQLVNKGASRTMNSKHITGDAIDIIPIIGGKPNFADWENFYPLAKAMQQAAEELGVYVRWGGMWARVNKKGGEPKQWVADYVAARKASGLSAFIDGPHFELG